MRKIGIFGASGMAREAGDIAWALGFEPLYIAGNKAEQRAWSYPGTVILEENVEQFSTLPFVIGIGENSIRRKVAERFSSHLQFTNLIHPSATFGRDQRERLERCQGLIIAAGVRLTSSIEVGNFAILNQNVTVAHDCVVEDYVHIAPGANVSGNVRLREGCWVGAGAVINQGGSDKKLTVNNWALVGSGAVVVRDCEPNVVYAGVPAKRIK
ncbi:NeuD/PglB/VioB family sugar acetyltransferase [Marinobacter sp. S0848L]|uniref:NeuD/PglB/VioB family sugar acetyltransferase n=1 Tax=Marinobacter sp. S0848L TaxID=2926423 RepID=UPI001FF396EA|nr:NeuD/PglB/VioB family sugar acetyltransferase [Marinobacter sp. S0848L]MCK0107309.1 NeuD/PglB/VioB family sugar acetyltransferase [Marinobacter sp. S0848L]